MPEAVHRIGDIMIPDPGFKLDGVVRQENECLVDVDVITYRYNMSAMWEAVL